MNKIYTIILLFATIGIASAQENYNPEVDESYAKSRTQKIKQSTKGEDIHNSTATVVIIWKVNDTEEVNRIMGKQVVDSKEAVRPDQEKVNRRKTKERCDE